MEFYFPTEPGEQIAFLATALTALLGCLILFAPGLTLKLAGLTLVEGRTEGYGAVRSIGGMIAGFAGTALLLAQPMVYLAFAAALALGLFARILSMMSDRGGTWRSVLAMVVQALIAGSVLAYVFGLI